MSIPRTRSSSRAGKTADAPPTPDQLKALQRIRRSTIDLRNLASENDLVFLAYLLDMAGHEADRLSRARPHDVMS